MSVCGVWWRQDGVIYLSLSDSGGQGLVEAEQGISPLDKSSGIS